MLSCGGGAGPCVGPFVGPFVGPWVALALAVAFALPTTAAASTAARAPLTVRVNGVELALESRVLEGEPAALEQRLAGRWGERLSPPASAARDATARRHVLGRQRGPFHETLTLLPGPSAGSARALVAVQDLRRAPAPLPAAPLRVPAGARLLNVVQFGRSVGAPLLFSYSTPASATVALQTLDAAARAERWQLQASAPASVAGGAAFWARRGSRTLAVVAAPGGASGRLLVLVMQDGAEGSW